jgi:phage tail sheath protein FI
VAWGARTLRGSDAVGVHFQYLNVRRLANYIEHSVLGGTAWAAFEPNDEALWARLRLSVEAFMMDLFRDGAFAGSTPRDAFVVKCDAGTTTETDRAAGVVNLIVGFAPTRPAEFVVVVVQQRTVSAP